MEVVERREETPKFMTPVCPKSPGYVFMTLISGFWIVECFDLWLSKRVKRIVSCSRHFKYTIRHLLREPTKIAEYWNTPRLYYWLRVECIV
jgi:hypothetical protein